MPPKPAHLAPSELGTKEYWDALYATELVNHANNPDDTGTVWFDDVDAESRMVTYLGELLEADEADGGDAATAAAGLRIVDLGCGNGSLLRAVRDELVERDLVAGQTRLLGVDYSEASIALAQKVTQEEDTTLPINLAVWDVLRGDAAALGQPAASWDVVLDKGTFDAISLGHTAADADANDDDAVESLYRRQVLRLLRPGGRFLVTSCNWTETELDAWMAAEEEEATGSHSSLHKVGRVAYPSFQFGGQQGQAVCTVCYTKKSSSNGA